MMTTSQSRLETNPPGSLQQWIGHSLTLTSAVLSLDWSFAFGTHLQDLERQRDRDGSLTDRFVFRRVRLDPSRSVTGAHHPIMFAKLYDSAQINLFFWYQCMKSSLDGLTRPVLCLNSARFRNPLSPLPSFWKDSQSSAVARTNSLPSCQQNYCLQAYTLRIFDHGECKGIHR